MRVRKVVMTTDDFVPEGKAQPKTESGGKLRDKLEAALKENKKRGELVAKLEAQLTSQKLATAMDAAGVPEKARAFYKGEPDAEAIKAWVEEHSDVLRLSDSPQASEQEQGLRAVQRADGLGMDQDLPGQEAWAEAAAKVAKSSPTSNPDALNDLFTAAGLGRGSLTPPQLG